MLPAARAPAAIGCAGEAVVAGAVDAQFVRPAEHRLCVLVPGYSLQQVPALQPQDSSRNGLAGAQNSTNAGRVAGENGAACQGRNQPGCCSGQCSPNVCTTQLPTAHVLEPHQDIEACSALSTLPTHVPQPPQQTMALSSHPLHICRSGSHQAVTQAGARATVTKPCCNLHSWCGRGVRGPFNST